MSEDLLSRKTDCGYFRQFGSARVDLFSLINSNRCMVGYVNASLSVFRVSDFEERSQPRITGTQLLGEDVKYCRY